MEVASDFGRSAELLMAAKRIIDQSAHELHLGSPVSVHNADMIQYLRQRLCDAPLERLMVIYCDAEDRYIHDEVMAAGDRYHVRLDPVQLFRRALKHDAHAILMAHNHPSGDATPSEDDICGTRSLAKAGVPLDIRFIDHLIVTPDRTYSMRKGGFI